MGSRELFEEAKRYLVGGVNSPVRAMKPYPFFTARAEGARLYDVDGNSYIDYCLAYGPLILGHAHPEVVEAVRRQAELGTAYGTPTELEVEFAKLIVRTVPCAEMVRFVNTGTEATMAAIRLARGATGRKKILKFEGAFHGAHDYVLVKAGSGATTHGVPTSAGVPEETTRNTLLARFNDFQGVEEVFRRHGEELACVILEPVMGNAGCILPEEGFLKFLREITSEAGALLIFDEVITGFRLSLGGAQEYYGVVPDVATLGKIAGGGLPIGILAGREELMQNLSPLGRVYQAGTFNGNPMSMAAGLAAVGVLAKEKPYGRLEEMGRRLRRGLEEVCQDAGVEARVYGVASMLQVYFTSSEVRDYESALKADAELFLRYQRGMLKRGVFLPPSQYESCFLSTAHTEEEVELTLERAGEALREARA